MKRIARPGSIPVSKLWVSFRVLMDGEWHPADSLIEKPGVLLRYYSGLSRVSCCEMSGGFFFEADGRPWEEPVDEFQMSETWFDALQDLLDGKTETSVWAWEESGLTLVRSGERIELEDIHGSGRVVAPRVCFAYGDFMSQMLRECRKFALLAHAVHRELDEWRRRWGNQLPPGFDTTDTSIHANLSLELVGKVEAMDRLFKKAGVQPK